MDYLEELVIAPFRDMVDKGTTAATNAQAGEGVPAMLTSAQNLVKEGQRALTRLEPLCKKGFHDGGTGFVNAVQTDEDLNSFLGQLEDLLWDFDELVEVASFDASKFSEVQALSRKVAPKMVDKLRRMAVARMEQSTSPFSSPVLHHSPGQSSGTSQVHHDGYDRSVRGSTASSNLSVSDYGLAEDARGRMHRISLKSDEETFKVSVSASTSPEFVSEKEEPKAIQQQHHMARSDESVAGKEEPAVHEEQPPSLPITNPWDTTARPASGHIDHDQVPSGEVDRRSLAASVGSRSPRLHIVPPSNDELEVAPLSLNSVKSTAYAGSVNDHSNTLGIDAYDDLHESSPQRPRPESGSLGSASMPLTRDEQRPQLTFPYRSELSHELQQANRASQQLSGSISPDHNTAPVASPSSYTNDRDGVPPRLLDTDTSYKPTIGSPPPPMPHEYARIAPTGLMRVPNEDDGAGLIPVVADGLPAYIPDQDCSITSKSSFHLYKGFCKGAREALRGGKGVSLVKRHGFTTGAWMTRCNGCQYELDPDQIEYDRTRSDKGTFIRRSIAYRLRFLQKSHLTIKRVDHIMYACVFCLQLGHTLNECDATVFFTAKQLLDHIARHPQPLPQVPGFTVIEGESVPPALKNNFDVHLMAPPLPHVVNDHMIEIGQRPAGIAREQVRKGRGEKTPAERSPAHEVAQGARLTGITWPPNFEGEYVVAWHEGVFASVPTHAVQLLPPPADEVEMRSGASLARAVAQWEFVPPKEKDKAHWLKFEEGEEIVDIRWKYKEHWCWTGTNTKGKRGFFPQAYIDSTTLDFGDDEEVAKRRLSTLCYYEKQRKRARRASSLAESIGSRKTSLVIGMGGVFEDGDPDTDT